MNKNELKNIAESLIETFNIAGQESIDLYAKGLKIEIKEDGSPVSNGDLKCNELITNKILELTPNIAIVSEETVDLKIKNKEKIKDDTIEPDFVSALKLCKRRRIGALRPGANRELFYKKDMGILARGGFSFELSKRVLDLPLEEFTKLLRII